MDYAAFKAHVTTFMWRDNDPRIIENLDTLIRMAEATMRADLDLTEQEETKVIYPTTHDVNLPFDAEYVRDVNSGIYDYKYITPGRLLQHRVADGENVHLPYYSLTGNILMLIGPFGQEEEDRVAVVITYSANVPDYQNTDTSWIADRYLDMYVYAVLKHAAAFVKDDARVQLYKGLYDERVQIINDKANWKRRHNSGAANDKQLPYPASPIRR